MNTDLNLMIVAKWRKDLDPANDLPSSLAWQDGTPATMNDFVKHIDDTHRWVVVPGRRTELHLYPNIVGQVRFDKFAGVWAVTGDGVIPAALEISDPNATDSAIWIELSTFPTVYRARIYRESAVA